MASAGEGLNLINHFNIGVVGDSIGCSFLVGRLKLLQMKMILENQGSHLRAAVSAVQKELQLQQLRVSTIFSLLVFLQPLTLMVFFSFFFIKGTPSWSFVGSVV